MPSPGCDSYFECGEWGECLDGLRSRTCYDVGGCGEEDYAEEEVCGPSVESSEDQSFMESAGAKIFVASTTVAAVIVVVFIIFILRSWNKRSVRKDGGFRQSYKPMTSN
ncbi:MAG: hypothetical protein ABH864_03575 [archaeon]